jgi:UDP-glucose:(heptosyl)LPS alpha-1,3-glucosyltransferase
VRFALAIVSLFPGGGLQRDCVEIARRLRAAGHRVTIFTSRTTGSEFAADLSPQVLPVSAGTNHEWLEKFSAEFQKAAAGKFDLLVGFDKLSSLDVLYCADRSMLSRISKNPLLHLLPRHKQLLSLERDCFAGERTKVLLLGENQFNEYFRGWAPGPGRFVLLPPTVTLARRKPEYRFASTRATWRQQLGLSENDRAWLSVGVHAHTKGFDRTIRALRRSPGARLFFVGVSKDDRRLAKFVRLAARLGVSDRIQYLGHREDVPELMAAADVLVHAARYDTTGTAILEAVVNGLPVITTAACGYARHVTAAGAGIVIQEPFDYPSFLAALELARDPAHRASWSHGGREYGKKNDLYSGLGRAAELIVGTAAERQTTDSRVACLNHEKKLAHA